MEAYSPASVQIGSVQNAACPDYQALWGAGFQRRRNGVTVTPMREWSLIRREVESLGLPESVLQIFDGNLPHPALWFRCQDPQKAQSSEGFTDRFIPLWECGTTMTVYDRSEEGYALVDLEAPDERPLLSPKFQGIVADLLINLWEDEVEVRELQEIAAIFDFSKLPDLLSALEAGSQGEYRSWRAALIARTSG